MATISTKDLSGGLADILARVAKGEEFTVVRGDQPVARIVPVDPATCRSGHISPAQAVEALRDFGRGHRLGDVNIKDLIEEGRL